MKIKNIEWDVDYTQVYEKLDSMNAESAAEMLDVPVKKYEHMTIEEHHNLAYDKFCHCQDALYNFMGLPDELIVPKDIDGSNIDEWLYDKYGYNLRDDSVGFEIDYTVIVQISFSLKTGLTTADIREKLQALKTKLDNAYPNYEVHSCHLSRTICVNSSLTTEIPDLFEEIFGSKYICELTETTLNEALNNMKNHRTDLAKKADRLVLLAKDELTNVALELQLFTDNHVLVI